MDKMEEMIAKMKQEAMTSIKDGKLTQPPKIVKSVPSLNAKNSLKIMIDSTGKWVFCPRTSWGSEVDACSNCNKYLGILENELQCNYERKMLVEDDDI